MSEHSRSETPPPTLDVPLSRRPLLFISAALGAISGMMVGLPVVGYFLGPILRPKEDQWIDVGGLEDFPKGQTQLVKFVNPNKMPWDGLTAGRAAYVRRRQDGGVDVFSIHCAHLGCPVNWFPSAGLFLCPCHGGCYYEDGSYASGPPPRGLFHMEHRLKGNRLEIRAGNLPTLTEPS